MAQPHCLHVHVDIWQLNMFKLNSPVNFNKLSLFHCSQYVGSEGIASFEALQLQCSGLKQDNLSTENIDGRRENVCIL